MAAISVEDDSVATRRVRRMELQALMLPFVLVVLVIVGTIDNHEVFFTKNNFLQVLAQASVVGVVALGMTFVIATGGIDLSSGSVLAAASIAGGQFVDHGALLFMLGTLGFALLLGAINGAAISY